MSNYPGDLEVSGECILLSSVSSQQKFEATPALHPSITALGQTMSSFSGRSVLQLPVTAQFHLESKGKHILEE